MANKIVRFALSESPSSTAVEALAIVEGVNITTVKYDTKIEKGENDLSTGFKNPLSQTPYPMSSTTAGSICHDYSGNLYVADSVRHAIYKIEEDNKLTLVAGLPGSSGNLSDVTIKDMETLINRAAFNSPGGICCDKSGNIYVADTGNHCIKMISGGKIFLVAGSSAGFIDDTDGKLAKFYSPRDLTMDKSGNLFVADTNNNAIRKIWKGGSVMTIAGNGVAGNASNVRASKYTATFDQPSNVSVDPSGNIYIIDAVNNFIKKITPNGWVYRFSGSGVVGRSLGSVNITATASYTYSDNCSYEHLTGMDTDASGNVYVVDQGLSGYPSRLIKIDASGRPAVIVDFVNVDDDYKAYDVTCTPAQKLFVTVSDETWDEGSSSSSSSSEDNR